MPLDPAEPGRDLVGSWLEDGNLDPEPDDDHHGGHHGDGVDPDGELARRFRDVLGRFASGITVVTGTSDGVPAGLTCQSFCSVSLRPPLVLVVPSRTSRAWPLIQASGGFCVNVLAHDQADLSTRMASPGEDKFAGLDWTPSAVTGSPVLPGTLAHLDCTMHAVHEAGDHDVVIGRVVDLVGADADRPLLYYRGRYRTTAD